MELETVRESVSQYRNRKFSGSSSSVLPEAVVTCFAAVFWSISSMRPRDDGKNFRRYPKYSGTSESTFSNNIQPPAKMLENFFQEED